MSKQKVESIFYLVDDYLYLYNLKTNDLRKIKFKNYISDGRIIKPKILIRKINTILKEEKLSRVFSNQNTTVIYNPFLKYIDKKIIIDLLTECNFKDIKLINTKDILDKNKYIIEINNDYLIKYYNNKYTYIKYNEYIKPKSMLKIIIKNIDDNIILIGNNKNISNLSNIKKNIYYLENSETYYIDMVLSKYKN